MLTKCFQDFSLIPYISPKTQNSGIAKVNIFLNGLFRLLLFNGSTDYFFGQISLFVGCCGRSRLFFPPAARRAEENSGFRRLRDAAGLHYRENLGAFLFRPPAVRAGQFHSAYSARAGQRISFGSRPFDRRVCFRGPSV